MATTFESLSLKGKRITHLRQLLSYIEHREQDEWYYGNREQFEKRHKELKHWIKRAVEYGSCEGIVFPK
jgi:hypothetical protein